jgi:Xaa-Pro aminopeptidase
VCRIVWDGRLPGGKEAVEVHGVDLAEPVTRLDATLRRMAEGRAHVFLTDAEPANVDTHRRIAATLQGRARAMPSCTACHGLTMAPGAAASGQSRAPTSLTPVLDRMRAVKSPSELEILRQAGRRSGTAYRQVCQHQGTSLKNRRDLTMDGWHTAAR